jgi:hypothetical protein
MSPPYTTPPPQNPPTAPKKKDVIVDEPSTDLKYAMEKFYGGLNNYKHKKPLEELVVPGVTVKEFCQHGDKDYTEFEYEQPFVPKHVNPKLSWTMRKIHE